MTFWRVDNSSTDRRSQINVTLDVQMFTCPLTKMDLKFQSGRLDVKLEDFHISEGTDPMTFAVLRNSTSSANVCLTSLFEFRFRKEADDLVKNLKNNKTL
mgnify:CR=1 FL=1